MRVMDEFPEGMTLTHGAESLFQDVGYCGHPEPPESDYDAWDRWKDDHPNSAAGDPMCILTPAGTFCPACTVAEREERDLPTDEYVTCRLDTAACRKRNQEG